MHQGCHTGMQCLKVHRKQLLYQQQSSFLLHAKLTDNKGAQIFFILSEHIVSSIYHAWALVPHLFLAYFLEFKINYFQVTT